MTILEQYKLVCRDVAKLVARDYATAFVEDTFRARLQTYSSDLSMDGFNQYFPSFHSDVTLAEKIHIIARTPNMSTYKITQFCKRIVGIQEGALNVARFLAEAKRLGLPESEPELRRLMSEFAPDSQRYGSVRELARRVVLRQSMSKTKSVETVHTAPRGIDPELLAISKTLPRRPGYVSFVRDVRFLPAHRRVLKEQGMVVFVKAKDGTGHKEFPMLCHFQLLKRECVGWVPKWFVPAGTGIALVKVKPTEYAETPLGEFEPRGWVSISTSDSVFNDTLRKIHKETSERDRATLSDTLGLFPPDKPLASHFQFEVGDWVYAPLTLLSGPDGTGQTHQIKAQIQFTNRVGMGSNYYTVRFDTCSIEIMGKSFFAPKGDRVVAKSLITQRAIPPIPYESRRGIGAKYDPTPYINLDWE